MRDIVKDYIERVADHLLVEEDMKKRIERDLYAHINELTEHEEAALVIERLGRPEDVAREFMDSIYEDQNQAMELIQERMRRQQLERDQDYEYRSRAQLFGLPLVHINFTARPARAKVAKGIIAIGNISIGLVSIGGIALGGLSLGGVSLGLLALGGLALGGLAVGGMAVGIAALGGFAIGYKIAMGGMAIGHLAVGGRAIGEYTLESPNAPLAREAVEELFRSAYPEMKDWMIRLFTWMYR